MKKAIILALLLLCIVPVSAQVWLGGELGFSFNEASNSHNGDDSSSSMQLYTFSRMSKMSGTYHIYRLEIFDDSYIHVSFKAIASVFNFLADLFSLPLEPIRNRCKF